MRNWERLFFKTYLYTITSFSFHTGATVQQQQNQLYRPFFMFSKGLFQPSTSKNCFGQMGFNLTKLREVFILNRPIIKNILHFLHSNHRLGEFKISSQVIFPEIYNFIIWVISFKGIFRGDWDDFGEMKTWVLLGTCPIIKTFPIFHTSVTIIDMHQKHCCNCFYF